MPSSSSKSRAGLSPKIVDAATFCEFKDAAAIAKFALNTFPSKQPLPESRQPEKLTSSSTPSALTVKLETPKLVSATPAVVSVKITVAPENGNVPDEVTDPGKSMETVKVSPSEILLSDALLTAGPVPSAVDWLMLP